MPERQSKPAVSRLLLEHNALTTSLGKCASWSHYILFDIRQVMSPLEVSGFSERKGLDHKHFNRLSCLPPFCLPLSLIACWRLSGCFKSVGSTL